MAESKKFVRKPPFHEILVGQIEVMCGKCSGEGAGSFDNLVPAMMIRVLCVVFGEGYVPLGAVEGVVARLRTVRDLLQPGTVSHWSVGQLIDDFERAAAEERAAAQEGAARRRSSRMPPR